LTKTLARGRDLTLAPDRLKTPDWMMNTTKTLARWKIMT